MNLVGSILEMNLQFRIWTQKQREKEQKLHAIKVLQELSAGSTDYFPLSTPLKPSPWGLAYYTCSGLPQPQWI